MDHVPHPQMCQVQTMSVCSHALGVCRTRITDSDKDGGDAENAEGPKVAF